MPNICYNQLSINLPEVEFYEDWSGSQAKRQERWDLMKKLRDELDKHSEEFELLNILRPEPKDIGDRWYDWRSRNWGTKWSRVIGHQLEPDLHLLQLSLETAWGPPLEICKYITDELGFEVRCLWECECEEWGIWEYGDIAERNQIERWSEDEFENLHDLLEDCVDSDSRLELLMTRGIFGSFESANRLEDHDREWIENQYRWLYDETIEQYEEWLDDGLEDHKEMMQMKQQVLSHTEGLLEKGEITEGDYLKLCSKLKTMSKEQLVLIIREANPVEFGKL